jgi:hypothetical protein
MVNRRFAVHEIRYILVRMRLVESDRQIAKAGRSVRGKNSWLRSRFPRQGFVGGLSVSALHAKPDVIGRLPATW